MKLKSIKLYNRIIWYVLWILYDWNTQGKDFLREFNFVSDLAGALFATAMISSVHIFSFFFLYLTFLCQEQLSGFKRYFNQNFFPYY